MEDLALLRQFVHQIMPLKEDASEAFLGIWQPCTFKRKTILTAAGETERNLYFVLDGIQRAFYIGSGNKEATGVFTYAPSFSGVADSFLTQTPSAFFFETLTASSMLRTTYQQVEALQEQYPDIRKLMLRALSFVLKGVLERQIELQCFSAEERFRALLRRSPHVLQLIPHKYLASYLGLDPATFSKLLGTVRLG
jgi:CRP-like cAMP-binding protein